MQKKINSEQQNEEFQLTLSKLSHEIRNPLTLISSELQMMSASHPEIISYREWDNIMENMDYMPRIAEQNFTISECRTNFPHKNRCDHLVPEYYSYLPSCPGLPWNFS